MSPKPEILETAALGHKVNHMRENNSVNLKPLLEKQLKGHFQLKMFEQCGLYWQTQACVHACICVQGLKC